MAIAIAAAGSVDAAVQPVRSGALTPSEINFLRFVIFDLKDHDLTETWVAGRLKTVRDRDTRGRLEYYKAQILRVQQKFEEYGREMDRLRKIYDIPELAGAGIVSVQAAMARVLGLAREARFETSPARKAELLAQKEQVFDTEVISVLETDIASILKQVEAAEANGGADAKILDTRDKSENYRVTAWYLYGNDLGAGTEEGKAALEKALVYAETFIDEREAFGFLMDCQLLKGRVLSALGRAEEAAEAFEVLAEITPPVDPPYSEPIVNFMLDIRLQAIQGAAEAYNLSGQPDRAVELFNQVYQNVDPDIDIVKARQKPRFAGRYLDMDLEEAIARIAGDERGKGLAAFRKLVDQYDSDDARRRDPQGSAASVEMLARGASRLIDAGAGGLPAELYYRAGAGYESRGLLEDAIRSWQRSLNAASYDRKASRWAASSLYKISEVSYRLDRLEEAAVGFMAYLERYPKGERRAKAALNAFAMTGELADNRGGPWKTLFTEAQAIFADTGEGIAAEQLKHNDAQNLEVQGNYNKARQMFQTVVKKVAKTGENVPFYFSAQASAARCLFQASLSTGDVTAARDAALAELAKLDEEAIADKSPGRADVLLQIALLWDDEGAGRDGAKAIAALEPIATLRRVKDGDARETGLGLWIRLLAREKRADEIDDKLALLSRDYPEGSVLSDAMAVAIDAHLNVSDDIELHYGRAAELAKDFWASKNFDRNAATIGELRWIADAMIRGKQAKAAGPVLELARTKLTDQTSEDERIGVLFDLAKAANAADDPETAQTSLTELIDQTPDMRQGLIPDSPYVYKELAEAQLKIYAKKNDKKVLLEAEKNLETSAGILYQRRRQYSDQRQEVPGDLEYDYWWTYLHWLKTWVAKQEWERVTKEIESIRGQVTDPKNFAPGNLQKMFDDLYKECEAKS